MHTHIIYMVNKKSRISEIFRKLSISERNVFYKSCNMLNDLFKSYFFYVKIFSAKMKIGGIISFFYSTKIAGTMVQYCSNITCYNCNVIAATLP